jgi:hypothetical protein
MKDSFSLNLPFIELVYRYMAIFLFNLSVLDFYRVSYNKNKINYINRLKIIAFL